MKQSLWDFVVSEVCKAARVPLTGKELAEYAGLVSLDAVTKADRVSAEVARLDAGGFKPRLTQAIRREHPGEAASLDLSAEPPGPAVPPAASGVKKPAPPPTEGNWSRPMPLTAISDRVLKNPRQSRKVQSVYKDRLVQIGGKGSKSWQIRLDGLPDNIRKELERP